MIDSFHLTPPVSLRGNKIDAECLALVEEAMRINKKFPIPWNRRKEFLLFLSQPKPLSSLSVVNVIEMEEMKREISSFL